MRARVETVIRDEAGNILSQLAAHEINLGNQSLHDIEGAVENWKQQALPEIEASLLTEVQKQFTQEIKKPESQL
jgi:predicted RNA polymerase sigma factor